jgi:hypothetical protein
VTDKTGPQEFWLTGEPNEHDVGIWYDHDPGVDVVYGKPFHRYHVVEYSAYAALKLELNRMQDCPAQVRSLEAEVQCLRSVLSEWDADKSCYTQMIKADAIRDEREKL